MTQGYLKGGEGMGSWRSLGVWGQEWNFLMGFGLLGMAGVLSDL